MNELAKITQYKENYYALFLSITTRKTAKDSLMAMGISPDNDTENEKE